MEIPVNFWQLITHWPSPISDQNQSRARVGHIKLPNLNGQISFFGRGAQSQHTVSIAILGSPRQEGRVSWDVALNGPQHAAAAPGGGGHENGWKGEKLFRPYPSSRFDPVSAAVEIWTCLCSDRFGFFLSRINQTGRLVDRTFSWRRKCRVVII